MPVELRKLTLSSEKFNSLPSTDRYVFALVGHVFNELTALQKLIFVSRPVDNTHSFVKDAEVAMALTLLRLLAGKTHEAMKVLSKAGVQEVLKEKYFRPVDGLTERWEETVRRYKRHYVATAPVPLLTTRKAETGQKRSFRQRSKIRIVEEDREADIGGRHRLHCFARARRVAGMNAAALWPM